MSTLEILLAFAILILTITAVIGMGFGNQSITVDAETNTEALSKAQELLENARADSRKNFFSVITSTSTDSIYEKGLIIEDLTPCKKQATSTITWNTDGGRSQSIELGTFLTDVAGTLALGGDCAVNPPFGGWNPPKPFATYMFVSAQPVALDVLNRIAYVVDDKKNLRIADTSSAVPPPVYHGNFISPPFDAGINLNDIDVAQWVDPTSGAVKYYAYVTRNENPNQFQVIDVTDINTPTSTPAMIKTLQGSNPPSGANSEGWRVFYYNNYAYVVTRETGGNEFHIFKVTTPTSPNEEGLGYEVNGTTNDFIVTGANVNGTPRRIAFLATDRSVMEIMVLDITTNTPKLITSIDLPDRVSPPSQPNALSIYNIGNRIYVGRQKSTFAPEFYSFKVSYGFDGSNNLTANLTQLGTQDMDGNVKYVVVSGNFAFIAVDGNPQNEFQVWNISNPQGGKICNLSNCRVDLTDYNLPNKISGGMDYEDPYIYVGSLANDPLQILYGQ